MKTIENNTTGSCWMVTIEAANTRVCHQTKEEAMGFYLWVVECGYKASIHYCD